MKINPQLEFDPTVYWQLNAESRFPVRLNDWRRNIVVTPRQNEFTSARQVQHFLREKRHSLCIAELLSGPEWRLLFYHTALRAGLVLTEGFDGRPLIAGACARGGWLTDVPEEWTACVSTARLCSSLGRRVKLFTQPETQMLSAIVAFFRAVGLEKHEVLQLPWFKRESIEKFLTHVEFEQ